MGTRLLSASFRLSPSSESEKTTPSRFEETSEVASSLSVASLRSHCRWLEEFIESDAERQSCCISY